MLTRLSLPLLAVLTAGLAFAQADPGGPVPAPKPAPDEVLELWPGEPPGERPNVGPEMMLVERRRPFYQITNVTKPTLSVYLPDPAKATGAAMLVLPGGGLERLAIQHEGLEVAEWLRGQGVAAFLLKYRVPTWSAEPQFRGKSGLQDAQRALGMIRERAAKWKIDPDGIAAIGFSAGAEIGTFLALSGDERQYRTLDPADREPLRLAAMLNIYPGGLAFGREEPAVRESVLSLLGPQTPPMFFAHAIEDASLNSILMALEFKRRKLPAELHLFQDGAHGFGVRPTGSPFGAWPDLALTWLRSLGYLDPPHVREYPRRLSKALAAGPSAELPKFGDVKKDATLDEAYLSQRRVIRAISANEKIVGFKGAAASSAAQQRMGLPAPITCALFEPGTLNAADAPSLDLAQTGPLVVETEIGYILGVDIPTHVMSPAEARTATQFMLPVIELPANNAKRMTGEVTARDTIASNCSGVTRIIVGERRHPDRYDPDELKISLLRGGQKLHDTTGAGVKGGQWANLMVLINQIVDQGHTLREGDILISGALGTIHPGEPGGYVADYGPLGMIRFELK